METFTLDFGRSWRARLTGRNPLVRRSDRLETIAYLLAATILLVTIPIAGTFATSFREARTAVYEREALSRHETTAVAMTDARLHPDANRQTFDVSASWSADDGRHVDAVDVPDMVRRGDQFTIWVDDHGRDVGAPSPPSRAAAQAVGWAALCWGSVCAVTAAALVALHGRLRRIRAAEWDRDLRALVAGGGHAVE